MQVDFYQLGPDPAHKVIPQLASKAKAAGQAMLVVSDSEDQLKAISRSLWEERPFDFLANGPTGQTGASRQPILLSKACEPENGAGIVIFADGQWREEGLAFDRAMLIFDDGSLQGARACWRSLDGKDGVERKFWKYEGGSWRPGP